jgi:LEA14-like dessication related protein
MKPEVREITSQWGEVTRETTELITTIMAYNPNPFSLPVKRVDCDFGVDGIKIGHAETQGLHIEKKTEFPIVIHTEIDNSKMPELWTEHIKRHEQSEAEIDIGATFDLLVRDFTFRHTLKRPLETDLLSMLGEVGPTTTEKKAKLPLVGEKTVLKITLDSVSGSWGEATPEHTELNLSAIIRNDNPYPLPLPGMAYDIKLNDIALSSGQTEVSYILLPNLNKTVDAILILDNSHLDECFVSHINCGERSTFDISASLVFKLPIDVAALLGEDKVAIPICEVSHQFETDIAGTRKGESG